MIDSLEEYLKFLEANGEDDLFLHVVFSDNKHHPLLSKPILVLVRNFRTGELYHISIDHQDSPHVVDIKTLTDDLESFEGRFFVLDKKSFIQHIPLKKVLDINVGLHLINKTPINLSENETDAHRFIHQSFGFYPNLNKVIPLFKHRESIINIFKKITFQINKLKIFDELYYLKINSEIVEILSEVESNGIFVDEPIFTKYFDAPVTSGFVYSQYNLLTSTGRPSNRFGGVNYAALNREDGSRGSFVSRFHNDGIMVMIDYSAFHPRIIANLTNFTLSPEIDFYKYIAELFFKKPNIDYHDIEDAKSLTFRQLYGGVEDKYSHIQYFYNLKSFIDNHWKDFNKNGYVKTPFFGRKITTAQIQDPNPNKLFNYILQATETEISVPILGKVNDFLRDKQSKAVLYTYDSVLFDVHNTELDLIKKEVVNIMKSNDKFPIKCYTGKSYAELKRIDL